MSLPVINIVETDKLSVAMESGLPFYIANKNKRLLVIDPETKAAEEELISALEAAENCKEIVTPEELWAGLDGIING